jgi:Rhodopirellula transposase DDE domain
VRAKLDNNVYAKGIEVTGAELATVNILRHKFHGEWNYTIAPRPWG